MKVIMLSGPSSSGKTTTLNDLYDALAEPDGKNIIRPKTPLGNNPKDFECVLAHEGKKVALFSMGDIVREVFHAMSFYEGMGCDVLVCVCNDRFTTPKYRLSRYPGSPQPVPKSTADISDAEDKRLKNEKDVKEIISRIQTIIKPS